MNIEPVHVGIFILVFIPGYLFIQTIDHYLLKGEKNQFEKTIQVLLSSTGIWLFALVWPWLFPIQAEKIFLLDAIKAAMVDPASKGIFNLIVENADKAVALYLTVCAYSFLCANIWGILRKLKFVDDSIRKLTHRDWYKTVALRFFDENMNATIAVTLKTGERYIGVLNGAPDDKSDNSIILINLSFIRKMETSDQIEKIAAESMLFGIDSIAKIEVISKVPRREIWLKRILKKVKLMSTATKVKG